jgi:SAM-dependent methyltransferase
VSDFSDAQILASIDSWKDQSLPAAQWRIVERQLEDYGQGIDTREFASFRQSLSIFYHEDTKFDLLEVGCSSGFYSRVLKRNFPNANYVGVDFSQNFIDFGVKKWPGLALSVMDAQKLTFRDQEFDCVVSGCVLLHIHDWQVAFNESARVCKQLLVLHRTPVNSNRTKKFTKYAYGKPTIEWQFARDDLINVARASGFNLINIEVLSHNKVSAVETLTFERNK